MNKTSFGIYDTVALVLYFITVTIVGLASMFRSNRSTVSGYFLAGRFMTWLPVGASLFASNIGSEHFIGLAGSGAASGIGVGAFEFNAAILLQLLGWVFLPVYIASSVCTLPEYMQKRFGGARIQIYLSCLSLLLYILTKISVNLYSGSLFIKEALGWNIWYSILLLLALTAIVTVTGGLTAVIYTDTLQFFIMILGAITLTILSFIKVGGFEGLYSKYGSAIARSNVTEILFNSSVDLTTMNLSSEVKCSLPSENAFIMLREVTDDYMPWLGFLLGQTPASIWYWCADQMMVQRVLAAKSLSHAQGACLFAGMIKLLPLFIMVMPGMISRVLYPNEIGCSTPEDCFRVCGQRTGCTNLAYPKLVIGILPDGLRGLMLAVMLAALMSDLTSIFNSASTLFTVDIYHRIRSKAKNRELMIVGRLFVIFMVLISILWVPVIQEMQGGQLFIYIQVISAYLAPPVAAVYLIAILWNRGNEMGAFSGLLYGLIIGLIRLVMDFIWREPMCTEVDTRPSFIRNIHYMYFALFSFSSTILVMIIGSFATKAPTAENLKRLTFWTINTEKDFDLEDINNYENVNDQKLKTMGTVEVTENGEFLPRSECIGTVETMLTQMGDDDEEAVTVKMTPSLPTKFSTRVCQFLSQTARWFCGLESNEESNLSESEASKQTKVLNSLKQNRIAVVLLRIGLISLLIVAASLYCFFSLYFGRIQIGFYGLNVPELANNTEL